MRIGLNVNATEIKKYELKPKTEETAEQEEKNSTTKDSSQENDTNNTKFDASGINFIAEFNKATILDSSKNSVKESQINAPKGEISVPDDVVELIEENINKTYDAFKETVTLSEAKDLYGALTSPSTDEFSVLYSLVMSKQIASSSTKDTLIENFIEKNDLDGVAVDDIKSKFNEISETVKNTNATAFGKVTVKQELIETFANEVIAQKQQRYAKEFIENNNLENITADELINEIKYIQTKMSSKEGLTSTSALFVELGKLANKLNNEEEGSSLKDFLGDSVDKVFDDFKNDDNSIKKDIEYVLQEINNPISNESNTVLSEPDTVEDEKPKRYGRDRLATNDEPAR